MLSWLQTLGAWLRCQAPALFVVGDRDITHDICVHLCRRHLRLAAAAHCLVADPGRLAKVSAPALFLVGDRDKT
jgi:pimeloyl-ACP methyl ester carboxylesterase